MSFKKILSELNVLNQCRKYGLPAWQCPQFLFLIMGLIIIASTLSAYALGSKFIADLYIVALVVLFTTAILFIISVIIIHSFEKLAEASRMKSEFVSIVSHQLRSPLTNINWALDFLISGRLGSVEDKQTEYFKIVKENSSRMAELISDLLTVSRIDQNKLSFKKEEFSPEEVVKEVIKSFNIFSSALNVELKLATEDSLPHIFSDAGQIKLIIGNLVDNAVRYVEKDGVVEVKLFRKGKNIVFEIKDNGVGIPKEDQKHIFQKFFRSKNALRYQTQGSGLGLYIVKSIAEKLGGTVKFKSQEGMGSTFWLSIPIKK